MAKLKSFSTGPSPEDRYRKRLPAILKRIRAQGAGAVRKLKAFQKTHGPQSYWMETRTTGPGGEPATKVAWGFIDQYGYVNEKVKFEFDDEDSEDWNNNPATAKQIADKIAQIEDSGRWHSISNDFYSMAMGHDHPGMREYYPGWDDDDFRKIYGYFEGEDGLRDLDEARRWQRRKNPTKRKSRRRASTSKTFNTEIHPEAVYIEAWDHPEIHVYASGKPRSKRKRKNPWGGQVKRLKNPVKLISSAIDNTIRSPEQGATYFIRPAGSFIEGQSRDPSNAAGGQAIAEYLKALDWKEVTPEVQNMGMGFGKVRYFSALHPAHFQPAWEAIRDYDQLSWMEKMKVKAVPAHHGKGFELQSDSLAPRRTDVITIMVGDGKDPFTAPNSTTGVIFTWYPGRITAKGPVIKPEDKGTWAGSTVKAEGKPKGETKTNPSGSFWKVWAKAFKEVRFMVAPDGTEFIPHYTARTRKKSLRWRDGKPADVKPTKGWRVGGYIYDRKNPDFEAKDLKRGQVLYSVDEEGKPDAFFVVLNTKGNKVKLYNLASHALLAKLEIYLVGENCITIPKEQAVQAYYSADVSIEDTGIAAMALWQDGDEGSEWIESYIPSAIKTFLDSSGAE